MTTAAPACRAAAASDIGNERTSNEDRLYVDESRGIFLVVDGVGGHAAGEIAAETAVQAIRETIDAVHADAESRIRQAITQANNRIYSLSHTNPQWSGMACVLTLAVSENGRVTVGHVGDSRLYLAWNGNLRKITSDHSLIGQQEERGEIDERAAMHHPRRNEILRDIGSQIREPDDPQFIQIKSLLFRPDAALLLCSDGLSDTLTTAEMNAIIEEYNGDPEITARQLIEASLSAGAEDNVSAIFAAGPEFIGNSSPSVLEARSRHSTTRMRTGGRRRKLLLILLLAVMLVLTAGALTWAFMAGHLALPFAPARAPRILEPTGPKRAAVVDPLDSLSLRNAVNNAQPGERIVVPPGQYLGPLILKDNMELISSVPRAAILRSDPAATADSGIGIVARAVRGARVSGFHIDADQTHPLQDGVLIDSSTVVLEDMAVSGAIEAGVRIIGQAEPLLLANDIHSNSGAGILIGAPAVPRIVGNRLAENGRTAGSLHAGIEVAPGAKPVLENNIVSRNGVSDPLRGSQQP